MKRYTAWIAAAVLTVSGIGISYPGNTARAAQPEDTAEEVNTQDAGGSAPEMSLQIPQKLQVTLDPWEMDGKGQIYSGQYVIRNSGEGKGLLTLSDFACRPEAGSGVLVETENEGLHEGEEKSVYVKVEFGEDEEKEELVLSEEGSEYQVELEPEEELSFSFTGEVNQNASEDWSENDFSISAVYSWNAVEENADESETEDEEEPGDEFAEPGGESEEAYGASEESEDGTEPQEEESREDILEPDDEDTENTSDRGWSETPEEASNESEGSGENGFSDTDADGIQIRN